MSKPEHTPNLLYGVGYIPPDKNDQPLDNPHSANATGRFRKIVTHQPGDTVIKGEGKRARRYVVMGDGSLRRMDKMRLGV